MKFAWACFSLISSVNCRNVIIGEFSLSVSLPLSVFTISDLTHPVNERTVAWPTASKFILKNQVAVQTAGGYWYEARDFSQAEHSGTHTDAPAHFFKDRWHTADIPLENPN